MRSRVEESGDEKNYTWTSFIICTLHDVRIMGQIGSRGIRSEIRRVCGEIIEYF